MWLARLRTTLSLSRAMPFRGFAPPWQLTQCLVVKASPAVGPFNDAHGSAAGVVGVTGGGVVGSVAGGVFGGVTGSLGGAPASMSWPVWSVWSVDGGTVAGGVVGVVTGVEGVLVDGSAGVTGLSREGVSTLGPVGVVGGAGVVGVVGVVGAVGVVGRLGGVVLPVPVVLGVALPGWPL